MLRWLNPHKYPIRVGLFIEVVGSLLAVLVVFVATRLGDGTFFSKKIEVYIWFFIFACAVAGLSLIFHITSWILVKEPNREGRKRIVMVIPALAQNSWFAELIQETFRHLHQHDYEVILKVPYEDFSKSEQTRIFQHLERHPESYAGGIIITHKHEGIGKELRELCNKLSYPIIFADVRPFGSAIDYPDDTAFVGYDERKIGELAAKRVATYLRKAQIRNPIVKVIGCANSQTERQDSFRRHLKELVPDAVLGGTEDGGFSRSKAKDIAVRFFDESVAKKEFIDAVFCTNDEMALGVYDAMLSVDAFGERAPFLIGVDGAKGAERLIRDRDAYFNATIQQPTKELAQKLVTILVKKIRKEFCDNENYLEPKMYDKEIAQAEGH